MASLFLMTGTLVKSQTIQFEKYTLPNGLKIILHEDHSAPVVAVTALYHVGSKNEDTARTGFAHFFEHLLFEGSDNIKRGEFDKYITNAGGALNANTSQDRTFYYELLPSNQVDLGLWLESERMMHAKIEQIGVNTQREVVKEEKRQRMDNRPYGSFLNEILCSVERIRNARRVVIARETGDVRGQCLCRRSESHRADSGEGDDGECPKKSRHGDTPRRLGVKIQTSDLLGLP